MLSTMNLFSIIPEHTIRGMVGYAGKLNSMVSICLHDREELGMVSKITHNSFANGALMF